MQPRRVWRLSRVSLMATPVPSPLTGVRCKDVELVLRALDELMQHAVQRLCNHIDAGETGLRGPSAKADGLRAERNWNAAMLNKLPVTCARLRSTARGDTRYAAVMFYDRTRLGAAGSGHFLEGLPPGLPLFSGNTAFHLANGDLNKLKLRDVVADRIKTVASLEVLPNKGDRLKSLVQEYTLSDVPAGLPGRVHVFIARMRAICQGLQRVKPQIHFAQCKNCECNRLFYRGASTEGPSMASAGSSASSAPTSPGGTSYWDLAGNGPVIGEAQNEFCTWSCYTQWQWQLEQALPNGTEAAMVADYQCRKTGRSRVPEALRLVGKRNERAGRHQRTIEKEQRRFPALGTAELKKQRTRRVRLLNVDLGLLYAASLMAESRGLSSNKVLAGASEGWRSRPQFYAKAVKEVGRLYDKHHRGGNVIANMLVHEPFLTKLKERSSRIF